MDSFPYQRFGLYFSELIRSHFENIELELDDHLIDNIYKLYLTGKIPQKVQDFVASLTQEQETQEQILDLLISQSSLFSHISQRFGEIIQQEKSSYKKQMLANDKLEVFFCGQLIIRQKLENVLTMRMDLNLDTEEFDQLLSELRKMVNRSEQSQFKENINKILLNQQDYRIYGKQARDQILEILLQRKLNCEKVGSILEEYDVDEAQEFLDDLEKINSQLEGKKAETQEDFNGRVIDILTKNYKKVKKIQANAINQILKQLYAQIEQLDIEKIQSVLIKARLAKNSYEIKPEMLRQIYQIDDQSFFKQPTSQPTSDSSKKSGFQQKRKEKIEQKQNQGSERYQNRNLAFKKNSSLLRLNLNQESDESFEQNQNQFQNFSKKNSLNFANRDQRLSLQRTQRNRQNAPNQFNFGVSEVSIDLNRSTMTERNTHAYYPGTPKNNFVTEAAQDYDDSISMPGDYSFSRNRLPKSNILSRSSLFQVQEQKSILDIMNSSSYQIMKEEKQKNKKQEAGKIHILNQEISSLKSEIKSLPCFQKLLREMEISVRSENQNELTSSCSVVQEMIKNYELQCKVKDQLQELLNHVTSKDEKLPKIASLRRKIEGLNLEEITKTKTQIELNEECNGASGVILIGETGAGKSTTLVGLTGQKLIFNNQTNDFQALNIQVRQKYKISRSTMSVTRWANVSKLAQMWTGNQKIVAIDTPGLDDNRGSEIDITNNIGTVKLLKTLKEGRILIVLSMKNFRDRWYSDFVRIIRSLSKYLTDIEEIKRSITFILTKGLTKQLLLSEFIQFKKSEGYSKENWSKNENQLIGLMESRIRQLAPENEIHDPSEHNFDYLVQNILKMSADEQIGNFISTAFSRDTEQDILNTFNYLKHMALITFKKQEYQLTQYYLNRLLVLEDIYTQKQEHENCVTKMTELLKGMVDHVEDLMNEYLETGAEKILESLRKNYNKLIDKQLVILCDIIYSKQASDHDKKIDIGQNPDSKNQLPYEMVKQIVSRQIHWCRSLLEEMTINASQKTSITQIQLHQVSKDDRIKLAHSFSLIKVFQSEKIWKRLLEKTQKQNKFILKSFQKFLQNQRFDQGDWIKALNFFNYQVQLNSELLHKEHDQITQLKHIVEIYLNQKCKEKVEITNLINQSLQISLDGALNQKCQPFFKKLLLFKNTNPVLKEVIESQIKTLLNDFEDKMIYFENQQQKCFKQTDGSLLNMFEIFDKNKKQIYQILVGLNDANFQHFRFEKKQESLLKNIENSVKDHTKRLWQAIQTLSKNSQSINFQKIVEDLGQIFHVLQFIKKSRNQKYNSEKIAKVKNTQNITLEGTLEKSEKFLNEVEIKIEEMARRTKVSNYQVNNKLTICYFVLKQMQVYSHVNKNQQKCSKRNQTKQIIKQKILYPFEQIKNNEFTKIQDFERLNHVLRYFRALDQKFHEIETNVTGFESVFPFQESKNISRLFVKCFESIEKDYKHFEKLVQLLQLKQITNDENNNEMQINIQLPQVIKQKSSENNESQQQSSEISLEQIDMRRQIFNDKAMMKNLIDYLLKHQCLKDIQRQFSQQIQLIEDNRSKIQQISIKQYIFTRIEALNEEMQIVKNPTKSKSLTREDLYTTLKEMEFISKVLKESKIKIEKYDVQDLKSQIKKIIDNEHIDFNALYKNASNNYKFLKSNVDFDQLKTLLGHSFSIDSDNRKRITKLLKQIEWQYAKNIKGFYPQLFKNTDILLNMAQFSQIVAKYHDFKIEITFMSQDYDDKCRRYFSALFKRVEEIKSNLEVGISKPEKQINEIFLEQDKILSFLPDLYSKFKEAYLLAYKDKDQSLKDQISQKWSLRYYITQKCEQIEAQISKMYFKQNKASFEVTQEYRDIYYNTTKENKLIMKSLYTERCKKKFQEMEKYLNQDHDQLQKQIKKLSLELQKIPQDIEKQIKEEFINIQKKQQLIVLQSSQKIQAFLNQKNLDGILREIQFAEKKNSEQMKKLTYQNLEKYYNDEIRQVDFGDLDKIQKKLNAYMKIKFSDLFIKLIEKNSQIKDLSEAYYNKICNKLEQNNTLIINKIKIYKQRMNDANKDEKFNVFRFNDLHQQSGIKQFIERVRLLKKIQPLFPNQLKKFVKDYEQYFDYEKKETNKFIEKFKSEVIKPFPLGYPIKYKKNTFINGIKQLGIRVTLLQQLNDIFKYNSLPLYDISPTIGQLEQLFHEIEKLMQKKYEHIQTFDFQSSINNDTQDRMAEYFTKLQQSVLVYLDLFPIICNIQIQSEEGFQHQLKQKVYVNFKKFEQAAIQDMNQCFQFPQKLYGAKIRKYYDFEKIMDKKKFKIFPKKIHLDNFVRKELLKKFNGIVNEIQIFSACQQMKKTFQCLLQEEIKVSKAQNSQITNKKRQINTGLEQYTKQSAQAKKTKISAERHRGLSESDQKLSISNIEKQYILDIANKRKDAENEIQMAQNSIKKKKGQEKAKIEEKINNLIQEKFLKNLIVFQHVTRYFDCQQKVNKYPKSISQLLKKVQKTYSKKFTKYLYNCLKQNGTNESFLILESPIFKSFQATVFAEETKGQTIQKLLDAVKQISNKQDKKNTLLRRYKDFENRYKQILDTHRTANSLSTYEDTICTQAKSAGQKLGFAYNNDDQNPNDIVHLLTNIFALWSIVEADIDEGKQVVYIYKPHAGQVLAVFLLLGLQQRKPPNSIKKRIIQVSTGEGKSVVLGVLSAYLALVGYHVYEACFSLYLSERDYEIFRKLFEKLVIMSKINYNIFPEICKLMLGSSQSSFKAKVQNFIEESKKGIVSKALDRFLNLFSTKPKQKDKQSGIPTNKKILLIDQADVFLDQHYLGQSYRPSIRYYTPNVEKLLYFVWKFRDTAETLFPQTIFDSEQFKSVISQYNNKIFEQILRNQVHGMIRDLQNFKNDTYTIIKGKIYYKEGDGLSDKIRYGYRTLFSYFYCHQVTKQINKSDVTPHIALQFIAASFSYSLLPQYFETILGVTGTLDSMSTSQKSILKQNFNLDFFVQPSIYPPSGREVSFIQCSHSKLNEEIIKSIDEEISKKRPVLIFFRTKAEVYNFADSKEFHKHKGNASIVTYEVYAKDRDFRIKTATDQSKITLLTEDFARGTDFKMKVKNKEEHPGLHVIGAYLPQTYSDYIQLIGRTGRQGRKGSAIIFIREDDSLHVGDSIVVKREEGESKIKAKEQERWVKKKQELMIKINAANSEHENSLKIYENEKPSIDEIMKNLLTLNEEPELSCIKSKTVICIDGTGSMSLVFDKVKQVVSGAVPDIYLALQKTKIRADFSLKFVIYRNYNVDHTKLLEYSNFQNKTEPLLQWLKDIKVGGGMGNEAIEVCFQYLNELNRLSNINQFIIIADAPSNTEEQTKQKRSILQGQSYWQNNNFPITCYLQERKKLIANKVKGHSYYIGAQLKPFFDELSKQTGGASQQFLIEHPNATKNFADFVANQILANMGDMAGGDAKKALLETYAKISSKKKYI